MNPPGTPDPLARPFDALHILRDPASRAEIVIALHDTHHGPAFGGIRRRAYASLGEAVADARRLAAAMTLKCRINGVPGGGGKAVMSDHRELDRPAAYRFLGQQVQVLGGAYYTGPDVGTEDEDLRIVAEETEFVARPGPEGPGDLAEPTAVGVFEGIRAVVAALGGSGLGGCHVAVQGLGAVGWKLAEMLHGAGVRLTVADVRGVVVDRAVAAFGAERAAAEGIAEVVCDVFAPCALGGVVTAGNAARIGGRAVAGSANNVLESDRAGEALWRRGVLYAPDFVINSGALVHGALFHLEGKAPPRERVAAIGAIVAEVLEEARRRGVPPEVVALERGA